MEKGGFISGSGIENNRPGPGPDPERLNLDPNLDFTIPKYNNIRNFNI